MFSLLVTLLNSSSDKMASSSAVVFSQLKCPSRHWHRGCQAFQYRVQSLHGLVNGHSCPRHCQTCRKRTWQLDQRISILSRTSQATVPPLTLGVTIGGWECGGLLFCPLKNKKRNRTEDRNEYVYVLVVACVLPVHRQCTGDLNRGKVKGRESRARRLMTSGSLQAYDHQETRELRGSVELVKHLDLRIKYDSE